MLKTTITATLSMLFILNNLNAQLIEDGNLQGRITTIINSLPGEGTNEFVTPTEEEFTFWGTGLAFLLDGDYISASNQFASIGYDLIEFTDNVTDRVYYLLENNGDNYWGSYLYYPDHTHRLVVQSPHPIKDFNTGKQGAYIFENTNAMFFFLAGTNRCNTIATVDCSGTTDVCSPGSKYKKSDMAHNAETVFQSTTDTLFSRYSDSYFLQLHGFTKTDGDPFVILSNGSKEEPAEDFISGLKANLLAADNTLTFEVAHENEDWDRLIGRTNTQGRLINGSSDPCIDNATANSGRFIHMEQEKTKLRADQDGWETVTAAVNAALNEPLPVTLVNFSVRYHEIQSAVTASWLTGSEKDNDYFELERSTDGTFWNVTGRIKGAGDSDSRLTYQLTDHSPLEGISYYRLKQTDYDGRFTYSPIRALYNSAHREYTVFPNPATTEVIIKGHGIDISKLRISDLAGKDLTTDIWMKSISDNEVRLDISNMVSGIYLVQPYSGRSVRLVKK